MRMQLWLVGLLVLLHSTEAVWSTARICRDLAPWLLPDAPRQGFPPSVEKFMLGLQQAQELSAASAPFMKDDAALMIGTFLRRVACADLAIFIQTAVALGECTCYLRTIFVCGPRCLVQVKTVTIYNTSAGEYGLSLVDPNSGAEFARCYFRAEGITKNRVQFVEKSGVECGGESGGPSHGEQMTQCMELKDCHGARHLILMPRDDIARDWEGSVNNVKAMLHSSFGQKSIDSVERAGGIKALLESLDHISPEIISQSVKATSAHTDAPRQSAFFLQNTKTEGSDFSPQSTPSLQSSAQSRDRSWGERVNAAHVARAPAPHLNSPRVDAASLCASRQHVLDPKPLAARSRLHMHGDISHESPQLRAKTQIVKHLQSLADNNCKMPISSAPPPAEIQKRMAAPPQRSPAAPAPAALLPHETRHYDTKSNSASPSLSRVLFSPVGSKYADSDKEAGSPSSEPSAGQVTAEVAARINSALAAFANFGK
jgi:hypothetical protein